MVVFDMASEEFTSLLKENQELKSKLELYENGVYFSSEVDRKDRQIDKLKKKYENAVADYEKTMFEKEQLKKQLEEKNKPQIFIDTQDIEERYAEGLYQDYLEEENKKIKKQLEEYQLQNINLRADIMIQKKAFPNKLIKDKTFYDLYDMPTYEDLLNQQKEFIEYMNKTIEELECDDFGDEEMKGYLIQRIDTFKEILSKYKEIIGVLDDNKTTL